MIYKHTYIHTERKEKVIKSNFLAFIVAHSESEQKRMSVAVWIP